MTEDTAVCTGDSLLALRDAGTFAGTCWTNALQLLFALTAFWYILALLDVLINETAAWCADTEKRNENNREYTEKKIDTTCFVKYGIGNSWSIACECQIGILKNDLGVLFIITFLRIICILILHTFPPIDKY